MPRKQKTDSNDDVTTRVSKARQSIERWISRHRFALAEIAGKHEVPLDLVEHMARDRFSGFCWVDAADVALLFEARDQYKGFRDAEFEAAVTA